MCERGSLDANQTRTTPVTREQSGSADPLVYVPLGLLGMGLLVAAAVAGRWLRRGIDTTTVRQRIHEERYSEWLSSGRVPEPSGGPVVWMESLEDLVDVAIDSEKRAIHDRSRGRYAVLDEDVHYYYDGDAEVTQGPPEIADSGDAHGSHPRDSDERVDDHESEVDDDEHEQDAQPKQSK